MIPLRAAKGYSNAGEYYRRVAAAPSYRAPRANAVLKPAPFIPPQAPILPEPARSILRNVIEQPDDDEPRHRMADWYDSHDSARAAFIRAQLAGEVVRPDPAWGEVFEPWCARDLVYVRGFVEEMSLAGRAFISLGAPLFAMTPLRKVRLVAVTPYLDELRKCSHVNLLKELELNGVTYDSFAGTEVR